jgi:hypothetical protein
MVGDFGTAEYGLRSERFDIKQRRDRKKLDAGRSPDYVAKHWTYPNASYQNLVVMATAAQNDLGGDD